MNPSGDVVSSNGMPQGSGRLNGTLECVLVKFSKNSTNTKSSHHLRVVKYNQPDGPEFHWFGFQIKDFDNWGAAARNEDQRQWQWRELHNLETCRVEQKPILLDCPIRDLIEPFWSVTVLTKKLSRPVEDWSCVTTRSGYCGSFVFFLEILSCSRRVVLLVRIQSVSLLFVETSKEVINYWCNGYNTKRLHRSSPCLSYRARVRISRDSTMIAWCRARRLRRTDPHFVLRGWRCAPLAWWCCCSCRWFSVFLRSMPPHCPAT